MKRNNLLLASICAVDNIPKLYEPKKDLDDIKIDSDNDLSDSSDDDSSDETYTIDKLNGFRFIIDAGREHALEPHLRQYSKLYDIEVVSKRLETGDIHIEYNGNTIAVIERKDIKDLANTIGSKRENNDIRLLQLCRELGALPVYMVSGNPYMKDTAKICRKPFKNLISKLDHLAVRGFTIIWCKDTESMGKRICALAKNMSTMRDAPWTKRTAIDCKIELQNTSVLHNVECYRCIPGIKNIANKMPDILSIKDMLIDTDKSLITIANMRYESGNKLGSKRAGAIMKSLSNIDIHIRILDSFNGITKDTAKKIIDKYGSLTHIINSKVTAEDIIISCEFKTILTKKIKLALDIINDPKCNV